MELEDLGLRERARGLGGKAHHQHRAEREIGREEARDAGFACEVVDLPGVEARRTDDDRYLVGEAA